MTFSSALQSIKSGLTVYRKANPSLYIYLIEAQKFQKSLGYGFGEYQNEPTIVSSLAAHDTSNNHITIGWVPSQDDLLSNDWSISGEFIPPAEKAVNEAKTVIAELDRVNRIYRNRNSDSYDINIGALTRSCSDSITSLIALI